jgi:hypothetical protein
MHSECVGIEPILLRKPAIWCGRWKPGGQPGNIPAKSDLFIVRRLQAVPITCTSTVREAEQSPSGWTTRAATLMIVSSFI